MSFSQMTARSVQPLSILADEFQPKIAGFNDLTRDLRQAGINVVRLEFPDNTIFIDPASVELLSRRFGHELRGMRWRTEGRYTRHAVTVRGIDVVWFSLVKEQDQ